MRQSKKSSNLKIELPFKPISVNRYYKTSRDGGVIRTGEGDAFVEEVEYYMDLGDFSFCNNVDFIHVYYTVYTTTMYKKDGSINLRGGDVDNYIKVLQDTVTKKLDVEDALITKLVVEKLDGENKTEIVFEGYNWSE